MNAWAVHQPGPIESEPLQRVERGANPTCQPSSHQGQPLRRLPYRSAPSRGGLAPKHANVTLATRLSASWMLGDGATRFAVGDRVGVAWLGGTDGSCRFCRRGAENLCLAPTFTGWDSDGGYADFCLVDEAFAYALPAGIDDEHLALLLCAGIIGYRALVCAAVPPGGSLGIYGFGGSAHLTAQVALAQGLRVHVLTLGEANRKLAAELGADSVGDARDAPPEPLDGAILFAPAGDLVPVALRALDRGGTLAVAGIWLSDIPVLSYEDTLFQERRLRSVTANTRADGETFLRLAERLGVRATTVSYPMSEAPRHWRISSTEVQRSCRLHN